MKRLVVLFFLFLALPTLGAQERIKVACIGDSITYGARVKNRKVNCFPHQLQILFGDLYEVKNYGVGGTTVQKKSKRSYWDTKQWAKVRDWQPQMIIIKLGTNDANQSNHNWKSKAQFKSDYIAFLQTLTKLKSRPTIYLCYPVPAYPGDIGKRERVLESQIIPAIREIAKEMKLKTIDLFTPLSGKRFLFPDEIHPNAQGAQIIAATIYNTITGAITRAQIPKDKKQFHIFLTMGQSNMSGYGTIEIMDRKIAPHTVHLPTKMRADFKWQPASHPINNRLPKSHRFGLQLPFVKAYLKAHPGVTVGLIPCAWGGASIDKLNKGTAVYKDALAKARFAQTQGVIKGVLWHQGESDTISLARSQSYEKKLHQLIEDIRRDLKRPRLAFIAGNLAEFYGTGKGHSSPKRVKQINQVKKALTDLPRKIKDTACVSSQGLSSIDHHRVHFDKRSYIIFGKRYAAALEKCRGTQPR